MAIRYQKTAKGQAELETRANRLVPRLRQALVMVDGRKTDDDLRPLLGPVTDETLLMLAGQGYITDAGPQPFATDAPVVPAAASASAAPVVNLQAVQRESARMLTDLLGPAAEGVALQIERAKTKPDLRASLEVAVRMIRSARGQGPAALFSTRFIDPL